MFFSVLFWFFWIKTAVPASTCWDWLFWPFSVAVFGLDNWWARIWFKHSALVNVKTTPSPHRWLIICLSLKWKSVWRWKGHHHRRSRQVEAQKFCHNSICHVWLLHGGPLMKTLWASNFCFEGLYHKLQCRSLFIVKHRSA